MIYAIYVLILILVLYFISKFIKLQLFIVSFQPLFIILFIKFIIEYFEKSKISKLNLCDKIRVLLQDGGINYVIIGLLIISIVPIFFLYCRFNKKSIKRERPYKYETLGDNMVSYVMTYIVPLTTLSISSSLSDVVGNIILFFIIMILYIRLDMSYVNPVLIILGFSIYKINVCNLDGTKYKESDSKYLITWRNSNKLDVFLKKDSTILKVKTISSDLLYEKKTSKK